MSEKVDSLINSNSEKRYLQNKEDNLQSQIEVILERNPLYGNLC